MNLRIFCRILLLIVIILSNSISALTGKISGTVTAAQSGEALPDVWIEIENEPFEIVTDK